MWDINFGLSLGDPALIQLPCIHEILASIPSAHVLHIYVHLSEYQFLLGINPHPSSPQTGLVFVCLFNSPGITLSTRLASNSQTASTS